MAYGNGGKKVPGLRRRLGMTKRPTAAGQARFGDVDVTGAQISDQEVQRRAQERMNRRLGEAASSGATFGLADELGGGLRGLVGAQMTEQERQRVRKLMGAQMTEAERRRLLRGGR